MFAEFDDFIRELTETIQKLLPELEVEIVYKRIDKVSLRIIKTQSLFIDIYANTETNRYDFSLIKDTERIFGYDNLGGWHYHPMKNPEQHIKCNEPSLMNILKEITIAMSDV